MYKVTERWKEPFNIDFLKLLGGIAESIGVFGMRLPITSNKQLSLKLPVPYGVLGRKAPVFVFTESSRDAELQFSWHTSWDFPGTSSVGTSVCTLLFHRNLSQYAYIRPCSFLASFLSHLRSVLQPFVLKRRKENLTDLIVICITYEIFLIESRGDSD